MNVISKIATFVLKYCQLIYNSISHNPSCKHTHNQTYTRLHPHTHTPAHTHTHTRARARTRTRTHTEYSSNMQYTDMK